MIALLPVFIGAADGLALLIVAAFWLWPDTRAHRPGCGCHGCYEANLREAYRQHQEEERHRRGEVR